MTSRFSLKSILKKIQKEIYRKDKAREKILMLSRSAIRLSAQTILATHRGNIKRAEKMLSSARKKLDLMESALKECPEMAYESSVYTAYQEYVEASALLSFISKRKIPSAEELKVSSIPYLLGLSDLVGELRRKALDSIKVGDTKLAEECLAMMEEVYNVFISIERGHALIPGFRMKCDSTRKRIELTRGDLSLVLGWKKVGKAKS